MKFLVSIEIHPLNAPAPHNQLVGGPATAALICTPQDSGTELDGVHIGNVIDITNMNLAKTATDMVYITLLKRLADAISRACWCPCCHKPISKEVALQHLQIECGSCGMVYTPQYPKLEEPKST